MCLRAIVLSATVVVLSIAPTAATCQTPEEQIEQFFRAGQMAMRQGQFAAAAEDFKKVLQLDPTLVEAEVNLGLACQGLLEYEQATRYLAKALRERPNLLGPNVIVGMDYVKLGSPEKGIPFLQTALKLDPSNRDAREALASSYLAQDNFGDAAEQFRRIADVNPDKSEALFKLGHEYLDLAARLAYRGAHLYRDSAWGHRFLGDLLYQRDRWQEAIDEYQKALAIEPQQPGLHAAMGNAYLHAQKFDQAEAEFRSELHLDAKSELAYLDLANLELIRNQTTAALDSLEKVWQISPEFLAVQREFPAIKISEGSLKASLSSVQQMADGPAKHFLLAALFTANNDSALADREWKSFQDEFSGAQRQMPNAVPGGQADQDPCKIHRYSRCIASLEARKHLTDSQWLLLGKARLTLRRYGPAADALAQVRGTSPENDEASYWLERTYQALGAEAYAQLEDSFPDSWRTHQLRAESYALRGSFQDALQEFQKALALRPNEPELHEALGELYLDHNDFESARGELEQTLAVDSSRTHALYLLGRIYVEQKDNEKALPYLERAVRIQPDLSEANSLLGTAYLRLGQFANAVSSLEKAAPSDHYGNVHYQLFVAYEKLGQPERARKELLRSQDLRKSHLERDQALVMGSSQPETEPQ
ncbi:MAG: tetratricopeptide repeat protein [Acidobacteriaceae bacterium]|nr:tetratricopeptide repeat protein [Acidobacteriaceae bacterium]